MNRFLILALCSLVIFSSCDFIHGKRVRGSGNVIMQSRNVSDFTGVSISGAMHLYLKQETSSSVKIETDDNLQQYIMITVENGVLRIRPQQNINLVETGKIKVFVSAPVFRSMEATGACNIFSENMLSSGEAIDIDLTGASDARVELKSPKVSADLTGASSLSLKGEAKEFSIDGSGSSNVRCFDLLTEETRIDMSGACDAEVFASVKLDVKASGASDVKYKGNAAVSQDVSGAGSVKKVQ
ncbi:MAG: head GIN domain-containing protein [Chitinophagales bacterium]